MIITKDNISLLDFSFSSAILATKVITSYLSDGSTSYKVSVNDLKEVNGLTTNVLYIGQELLIPSQIVEEPDDNVVEDTNYDTYVVQKGDSLWAIAQKYGITVQELINLNNLSNNTLQVGQKLLVPKQDIIVGDSLYTVVSGDTLWSIARKFNVSVNDLKLANGLDSNLLSIGQQLIIP